MRNFYWIGVVFLAASLPSWGLTEDGEPAHMVLKRYALVVGSNRGGEGRIALRYAGRDARTFEKVLRNLGGVNILKFRN